MYLTPIQLFVGLTITVTLGLVGINRLRAEVAALAMACLFGLAQALGAPVLAGANQPEEAVRAISGLGQPVIITLFSLFVITECLEELGITSLIARRILRLGHTSERWLITLFATAAAVLSLFMNTVAAGALVMAAALAVCRKTGVPPSKLLIPISYGSLLGGAATYFTTANIIASQLLTVAKPPQASLHIFSFAPTGGLIAIAGLVFLALFGKPLLPKRPGNETAIDDLPTMIDGRRARLAVAITIAAIGAAVVGLPVYLATLAGALLMILLGLGNWSSVLAKVEWPALLLVAGMYAVGLAMVNTGLAGVLGNLVVNIVTPLGDRGLAAGAFLLTAFLAQVMGGQVAILVSGPIMISAAMVMGANPQAITVAAATGCSAAFLTPVAHPVNWLMMAPGGYRFSDFFRIGLFLMAITFLMLMLGMAVFWRL
jgi:di/tricarboxylate transporter